MTREELSTIARAVFEKWNPADIDRPVAETALDSLDLLMLRSALETHIGHELSDDDWFGSDRLAQLLPRL